MVFLLFPDFPLDPDICSIMLLLFSYCSSMFFISPWFLEVSLFPQLEENNWEHWTNITKRVRKWREIVKKKEGI